MAGFPDLFLLYGARRTLGLSSIGCMLEAQRHYVIEELRVMRERGAGIFDVRPEAQEDWTAELQARLGRSIWNTGGCRSWYLDANGRNSVQWPDFTFNFRRRVNRFDPGDYVLQPRPSEVPADALP